MTSDSTSELNQIIPPEIQGDEFYRVIYQLAQKAKIKTVLEIGSSSGGGSTDAFVRGLRQNPVHPKIFCMEVSQVRFKKLKDTYQQDSFVHCYNVSSVAVEQFPSEADVANFYHSIQSPLQQYPLEQVIGWLHQDIEYIKQAGVTEQGIQAIKAENKIDLFDLVLIDGSEFTGSVELDTIYGAKLILLDDILTFKNYYSHQRLLADPNYRLVHQNLSLRHGYSIFSHVDYQPPTLNVSPSFWERLKTVLRPRK